MKTITVNEDDYNIVKLIKDELNCTEPMATTALFEIGLYTILTFDANSVCTSEKIKEILLKHEWISIANKLKQTYCM